VPVLLISHDADDGIWQLIGASDADARTGKVAYLHHAVDGDPSLLDVLDLPAGRSARSTVNGATSIRSNVTLPSSRSRCR